MFFFFKIVLFLLNILLDSDSGILNDCEDYVLLNNKDTIQVIKKYPGSCNWFEVVYYERNKPYKNVGYFENGDTIRSADIVITKENKLIFVFVPLNYEMQSYDVLFAIDKANRKDSLRMKVYSEIEEKLKGLKASVKTKIKFRNELVLNDGSIQGILKSYMKNGTIKYFPFLWVRKEDSEHLSTKQR